MRYRNRILTLAALFWAHAAVCQVPRATKLSGDYPLAHDPSIAKDGDTYYVFTTSGPHEASQIPIRCSKDLLDWKECGHVFTGLPAWIHEASPKTRNLWAPDISYFSGKYHLYYAYSVFGLNTSGIALATNVTLNSASPQYKWNDEGQVLTSTTSDDFNAIDPNIVLDNKGQPWLSFGSFWAGIKMRRINTTTGKLSTKDNHLYALASRKKPEVTEPAKPGFPANWQAVEAPFIVRHGEYFYLFVSFDLCCRGTRSTYRIMVGRSRKVTGPYRDQNGKKMSDGGGTQILAGNSRWLGPGGQSVLQQGDGDSLVFHAYDAVTGKPALQISTIAWKDGWPHSMLGDTGESK
jgi:arabinan endo-1,5-alpha-L-arabinosidase